MNTEEAKKHRYIKLAGLLALCAGWLAFQLWLWVYSADYLVVTAYYFGISPQFALANDPECLRLTSILGYFTTLLPVLAGYYFTVMRPRRFYKTFYWSKKRTVAAIAAVAAALLFSLFTIPKFYFALFPGWEDAQSPASRVFRTLVISNVVLGVVGTVLAACLSYIPAAATRRPFAPAAMRRSVARYALCVLLGVLSALVYVLVLNILGVFDKEAVQSLLRAFSVDPNLMTGSFTMTVMAPLVEEPAFRGLMFGSLKKHVPVWLAVVISAFFFGFWHNNLGQLCACFCLGILFACIYHKTNRLRYAMLAHSVSNFTECLCLATGTGPIPYIPFLHRLRDWLLGLSLPVSILSLPAVVLVMIFIVRRLKPVDAA